MIFEISRNTLTAYGIINEGDGMAFVSQLNKLEAKHATIIVKLHTDGGSVFDGNLMYTAIQDSPSDVTIQIVGIAASMGAVISLASDKVYMVENGYMMIHAPSGLTYGTVNDHENNIKLLQAIERNFIKKLTNKTGKNEAYVTKWLKGDNWFDANEALAEGLITGIIQPATKNIGTLNPKQLGIKETYRRYSALLLPKLNLNQMELLETLIGLLELKDDATQDDVLAKIQELADNAKLADAEKEQEAQQLIANAVRTGRITPVQQNHIAKMFITDFTGTKEYLNSLSPRQSISSMIVNSTASAAEKPGQKSKSDWTLDDYRKHAPKELEANPSLYKKLIEAKKKQ